MRGSGPCFSNVHYGRERWRGLSRLPRHRHEHGYAAVVIAGGYTEAGDGGRHRLMPGTIVFHRPFEAHRDEFGSGGAVILNLPLPQSSVLWGTGRLPDPDAVIRAAEKNLHEAACLAVSTWIERYDGIADWPDLLARDLRRGLKFEIGEWAHSHGLAPETVSRGFRLAYGTTPSRYRAEARARAAWQMITSGDRPLADIAASFGFADQAHMTRAITDLTGRSPGRWRPRPSNWFNTDEPDITR